MLVMSSSWPVRQINKTPPKHINMQIISINESWSLLNFHPMRALMNMAVAKIAVNTAILMWGKTNVIDAKVTRVKHPIKNAESLSFTGILIGTFFTLRTIRGIVKLTTIRNRQISIGAIFFVFTMYLIIALYVVAKRVLTYEKMSAFILLFFKGGMPTAV